MENKRSELERGHLDSEDSLLDGQDQLEMQNPLNNAPPAILENMNNNSISLNNPSSMMFSDDEVSSTESSVAKPRTAIPEFDDRGDDMDDGLDDCSDCGSMAVDTMRYSRARTSAAEEECFENPPPASGVSMQDVDLGMEDVDLGTTNRIMALREPNNNSNDSSGVGDGDGAVRKTIVEGSTAEPSPSLIVPGDGPSSGGDLTEVGAAMFPTPIRVE